MQSKKALNYPNLLRVKNKVFHIILLFLFLGCENDKDNFFPLEKGKLLNYHVEFYDGESEKKQSKLIYTVVEDNNLESKVLGNSGQIITYSHKKEGIRRESIDYLDYLSVANSERKMMRDKESNHFVLKYPLTIGTNWTVNDLTRSKMKIGYDKVFETWLPFKLENKITSIDERVRINNKVYKNCIKVVGRGKTSFNAGPPLGNINIEILNTDWYAYGVGLVKTIRIEKSDSETMGNIKTVKTFE